MNISTDHIFDSLKEIFYKGALIAIESYSGLPGREGALKLNGINVLISKSTELPSDGEIEMAQMKVVKPFFGFLSFVYPDELKAIFPKLLLGKKLSPKDLQEMETEGILEMANLLLSSILVKAGEIFSVEVEMGPPCIEKGSLFSLLVEKENESDILLLEIDMTIEEEGVTGDIKLILSSQEVSSFLLFTEEYQNKLEQIKSA